MNGLFDHDTCEKNAPFEGLTKDKKSFVQLSHNYKRSKHENYT